MIASILATLVDSPSTAAAMCSAGLALLLIAALAGRTEIAEAHGLDKIVALRSLSVAVPLAVFGALHLAGPQFVSNLVPPYMPGRMFWVYAVGCFLIAASLSIATNIQVRWAGLLLGIMMFLFVAMIHFPGALRTPDQRVIWMIVVREMSFGGAGWLLAANAMPAGNEKLATIVRVVGKTWITLALVVFGIEHFLHPHLLPGVPLAKEMPLWIPAQALIDYVTGAALLAAAASVLLRKKSRTVVTLTGAWLLLLIIVIYTPFMVISLLDPAIGVQLTGVNYFADTLLFAGAVLALAQVEKPDQRSPA
ncbi:MAG: hypothetical protein ABJE47_11915 [bacterium]